MKRVLLAQDILPEIKKRLEDKYEVVISPAYDEKTLQKQLSGFHAILMRTTGFLSRDTIFSSNQLEVIGRTGAGVDNVDLEAATEKGIPVCNAPEANYLSVAELTVSFMMALSKELFRLDREVRNNNWKTRENACGFELRGKTVALVGFGRIGNSVATIAKALQMKVKVFDPFATKFPSEVERVGNIESLVSKSDFVSLHAPLTDQTKNIINQELLSLFKPGSFLINTSRGGLVDEQAVSSALRKGQLKGAAFDVFAGEPITNDHPFCKLPNVIVAPHCGALSQESRIRNYGDPVDGIIDVLEGRKPQWVASSCFLIENFSKSLPVKIRDNM